MTLAQRLTAALLGIGLVLHGLGHAVLPMRAADIVDPGTMAPMMTALYVLAMIGFVAAGLGMLGVAPLSRAVRPIVLGAALAGLGAQAWYREADLWPGVLLSLVLPLFTIACIQAMPPRTATARRPAWARLGDAAGFAVLIWVAATAALWPWHRAWGTAPHEWQMALPGDPAPRTPRFEVLHAVTIDAPPAAVWPWLIQIGHDRAGFYSYDWIERLFLADVYNAREIRPEWQTRAPGERVAALSAGAFAGLFGNRPGWTVARVHPQQALVLEHWGAFVLLPTPDGRTRFLIRATISSERMPVWGAAIRLTTVALPHFLMQRRMMLTIKALAERAPGVRGPDPGI